MVGTVVQVKEAARGSAGASAYAIAVANGFVGSQAAWLASLKGDDGAPGLKGDKGDKGDQGAYGTQIGGSAPSDHGLLWLDMGTVPATLKYWDGATWSAVAGGGGGIAPTLADLGGVFSLAEDAAAGTVGGALTGKTLGSSITLTDNAGGRVALSGTNVIRGATALDYETAPLIGGGPARGYAFETQETLIGATNTPHLTQHVLLVTDVVESTVPTLTTAPAAPTGLPFVGQTLYASDLGVWTGAPTSYAIQWYTEDGLIEDATDDFFPVEDIYEGKSFHYTVLPSNAFGPAAAAASSGTKGPMSLRSFGTAPILARTSASGASPVTFTVKLPSDTFPGDFLRVQAAGDEFFTEPFLYEGLLELDSATVAALIAAPGAIDLNTLGIPALDQTDFPRSRWRVRLETHTPLNADILSGWSNNLDSSDAAWPVVPIWLANANFDLTNGNLTANKKSTASASSIRCNVGIPANAAGDHSWSHLLGGSGNTQAGFCTAAFDLNGADLGLDADNRSIGLFVFNGDVWFNGVKVASGLPTNVTGTPYVYHLKNGKVYILSGSTPVLGDHVAETGGINIGAALGATLVYPVLDARSGTGGGTGNFGGWVP